MNDEKQLGLFILRIFLLAQLIAFIISLIPYFSLLSEMRTNPESSQLVELGSWFAEFIKAQVYGWPFSIVINFLWEFVGGKRRY